MPQIGLPPISIEIGGFGGINCIINLKTYIMKFEEYKPTREELLENLKKEYMEKYAGQGYPKEFKAQGFITECNFGGVLIIISDSGVGCIVWSDWSDCAVSEHLEECEFEYRDSEDDENDADGAFVTCFSYKGDMYNLDEFMRV